MPLPQPIEQDVSTHPIDRDSTHPQSIICCDNSGPQTPNSGGFKLLMLPQNWRINLFNPLLPTDFCLDFVK
jgi:hypothetical protein